MKATLTVPRVVCKNSAMIANLLSKIKNLVNTIGLNDIMCGSIFMCKFKCAMMMYVVVVFKLNF